MLTVEAVANFLRKHAPDIARLVEKDMTVSDVHVPAALPDISVGYIQGGEPAQVLRDDDEDNDDDEVTRLEKPKEPSLKELVAAVKAQREEMTQRKVFEIDVRKADAEQRKVFGWASISAVDGVEVIDKQGDIIPISELEKAAHDFALHSRIQGDMHSEMAVGSLIESVVHNAEKRASGVVAKDEEGRVIDGWWIGFYVHDDATWAKFKRGERPEFSIAGKSSWEPL